MKRRITIVIVITAILFGVYHYLAPKIKKMAREMEKNFHIFKLGAIRRSRSC
jgi:hypothetical protein